MSAMVKGSRVPRGVTVQGSVRGQGDLWIAGEIEGPVEIEGQVVIEPSGVVRGEVRGRSVVIAGLLEGNATATELVRLEPGARMVGDARAERVSAAAGALLKGRIRTAQDRGQLERLRRTTGGTLLAPFSSSGALHAPVDDQPPPATARTTNSGWERAAPEREPLPRSVGEPRALEREPARPPTRANDEERPPPPLIPPIGRRRAQRRETGGAP
ncbi:MAG: hypothetical protein OHK0013_26890 [Sandaracinaceae bacterium]